MRIDADLTQGEIPRQIKGRTGEVRLNPKFPHDGCCASGHSPAPPVETRFFHVFAKKGGEADKVLKPGVYCEWCLTVANRLDRLAKEGTEPDFDPVEECCGEFLKEPNPEVFDSLVTRLKWERAYRIDWELLREACSRFTWS